MHFYIDDHRPALVATVTSIGGATVGHLIPIIQSHPTLELVKLYLSVFGQVAGILSGLAAFAWYAYSIYKARKEK